MNAAPHLHRNPNWGVEKSFRCSACEEERRGVGGTVHPTGALSFILAVCRPCADRIARDEAFSRHVKSKFRNIAFLAYLQRVADVVGVPASTLHAALSAAHADAERLDIDLTLELAPGTFTRAARFVALRSAST